MPPQAAPVAEARAAVADDRRPGLFGEPGFADASGRASTDPLALLPAQPVIDLAALALMVSSPALELEFMPASPWRGLTLRRARPPWPAEDSDPGELHERFGDSVGRCMEDAGTVAVFFSGGLDSLAVLLHARAIAMRQGRRVVAVTVDLLDDNQVPVSSVARGLIAALAPECDLAVISPSPDGLPEPPWRPQGPYLRGLPRLNRAANEAAARLGAGVMLNGNGGDELFMTRDYLALALAGARRWHDLTGYLGDICRYYGPARGLMRETLAVLAPLGGARRSFQLYTAVQTPALAVPGALGVISPQLRPAVISFARSWLSSEASLAARSGPRPWCRTLARDMVWPLDPAPGYGPVPERSPFMDPGFARYAVGLPLAATYSAAYRVPYHRHKALVAGLAGPGGAGHLPAGKQQFGDAVRRYFAAVMAGRPLTGARHGLFSGTAAAQLAGDPRLAPVCHAIDVWLDGAITKGATVG
ncbi:MAG: asparagine synthase-related protein [Streptosporangiaceae bacterium]